MRATNRWENSVNLEDLLLIGGLLMALAVFGGTHAHAASIAAHEVTATASAVLK